MKKFLFGMAIFLVVGLIVIWTFRNELGFWMFANYVKPDAPFAETAIPTAPNYSLAEHWAALPSVDDNADVTLGNASDAQSTAAVDVFFIYPTTFITSEGWNAPLDHDGANEIIDDMVLPHQASAFNGCCAVYAPRYRQATMYSFFDQEGDGKSSLDLAYGDVVAAFEYFLEHFSKGRPFIIAGHSQGARHAELLLNEHVYGTPLADRLVAAYPVGFNLSKGSLPVCATPLETGCAVTWNTVGPGFQPFEDTSDMICVNPLTFDTSKPDAGFDANLGSLLSDTDGSISVIDGAADGQCANGLLTISELRSDSGFNLQMGTGNYHVYDFSLFYFNIRENAKARVDAFLDGAYES
ncbi:MAG: DUF3089 domain-containing protein [Pseudomonadaceae bacterium]|nr:DUF3089 domain-containing protein [Pseudomonadaceae bacterium]